MAWPKIKNIIILMLLVTNLCLLAFVGWREIRDWQLQEKALEQEATQLHAAALEFIICYHQWFTSDSHSMLCRNQVKCSTGGVISVLMVHHRRKVGRE